MRCLVSDTGPLLHLFEAQALHVLPRIGNLYVPRQVVAEISRYLSLQQIPEWISIETLADSYAVESTLWQQAGLLDAGEAEAIALARQLQADWLLTDDAAARLLATEMGLEVHGSLGVILGAAAFGQLNFAEADQMLSSLAKSSLWISDRVMAEARAALQEICRPS